MKLRCTHDSIRIRIRKSELAQLKEAKVIEESVHFGVDSQLVFALQMAPGLQSLSASYVDGRLVVALPEGQADAWINSQQVGIETNLPVSDEHKLQILIEKDFPCLDRVGEDKSDTFWELAPDSPEAC